MNDEPSSAGNDSPQATVDAVPQSEARAARTAPVVVPHQLGGVRAFVAWLIYTVICLVGRTIRVRWATSRQSLPERLWGQVIICAWHNRTFFALPLYFWHYRRQQPDRRLAAMTSASKDGAVVARVFELFGAAVARGSTSRRGRQALLELSRLAARGYDLAITPDGPRGPCYEVQPGIIALAQVTGLPIAPVSYRLYWKLRFKSWDRFMIPIPFTRCDLVPGELVTVPRDATPEEREAIRVRLEAQMRAITMD